MLAELEEPRHIFRVGFQQLLEMRGGGVVVTQLHAFQRQPVTRESVSGFLSDKLFKHFAARLLCLGHRSKTRIIAGLRRRAKYAHFERNSLCWDGTIEANNQDQ